MEQTIKLDSVDFVGSSGMDRSGRLFRLDGGIYRALSPAGAEVFTHVMKSGRYNHLVDVGLIESEMANLSVEGFSLVLKHRPLTFISFCAEWPFEMLKDAAIMFCRLNLELLAMGLLTKDAHPWNVAFDFSIPKFVDFGSLEFVDRVQPKVWCKEFMRHFYIPLWLASRKHPRLGTLPRKCLLEQPMGFSKTLFSHPKVRTLMFTYNRITRTLDRRGWEPFLRSLVEHLQSMDVSPRKGVWSNYQPAEWKKQVISQILPSLDGHTLIDIAANRGDYGIAAAEKGMSVVAFDLDEFLMGRLYKKVRVERKSILPLVLDFLAPTSSFGSGFHHEDSFQRLRSDVSLALSLIHHIVFKSGKDFQAFALVVSRYTRRYAFVEFIPLDDRYVAEWVVGREADYGWYTDANFVAAFMEHFKTFRYWDSPVNNRKLYLFER